MRVALLTTFTAGKKEPLAEVLQRIHQAFLDAGLGGPVIRFSFGDAPMAAFVSSVDRVLKRHPELERFLAPGPARRLAGDALPFPTLHEIAAGVPRSFPFHNVVFHFHSPEFGGLAAVPARSPELAAGVLLTDSWWVNGRNRSLTACVVMEAEMTGKKLPPLPEALSAVLAACGKAKKTVQAPLPAGNPTAPTPGVRLPGGQGIPSANPQMAIQVHSIAKSYRDRLSEIMERARMPHDLPPQGDRSLLASPLNSSIGPKKPALVEAFGPLGYTCHGEATGSFTLRRRTAGNLTVELHLDTGASVLAMYRVLGVGFKGLLTVPACPRAVPMGQYPIVDADHWRQIVENLAAIVAELDRSLAVEIEAAAGPQPEWYRPES